MKTKWEKDAGKTQAVDAVDKEAFPPLCRAVPERKSKRAPAAVSKKGPTKVLEEEDDQQPAYVQEDLQVVPEEEEEAVAQEEVGQDEVALEEVAPEEDVCRAGDAALAPAAAAVLDDIPSISHELPSGSAPTQPASAVARKDAPLWQRRRLYGEPIGESEAGERQKDEITVLGSAFPGCVVELDIEGDENDDAECTPPCQTSPGGVEDIDHEGHQPSAPVRRYIVTLSGKVGGLGSSRGEKTRLVGARGTDEPRMDLEVTYGRLYPVETPMLRFRKVNDVPKQLQEELFRLVWAQVAKDAGQECIFQVCDIIHSKLMSYTAEVLKPAKPLHEMMMEQQKAIAQKEEDERRKAKRELQEAWQRRRQEEELKLLRYQEKQQAAKRVEGAGLGTLDFLPSDDIDVASSSQEATSEHGNQEEPIAEFREEVVGPTTPAAEDAKGAGMVARDELSWRFRDDPHDGFDRDDYMLRDFSDDGFIQFKESSSSITFAVEFQDELSEPKGLPAKGASPNQAVAAPAPKAKNKALPAEDMAKPEEDRKGRVSSPPPTATAAAKAKAKASLPEEDQPTKEEATPTSEAPKGVGSGRYALDFEELGFLGRGGFGSVMKVRNKVDRQLYAIKRIDLAGTKGDRAEIIQECSLLPRLTHLHIIRYYQAWIETEVVEAAPQQIAQPRRNRRRVVRAVPAVVGANDWLSVSGRPQGMEDGTERNLNTRTKEYLYIQMEYCDGKSLKDLLDGDLLKDEALIWKLFRQVLDALAFIHGKGLIHRDLKPPNVFLSKEDGGHAKLGDFGLTTSVLPADVYVEGQGAKGQRGKVQQSIGVGTPLYMAPEVRSRSRSAHAGEHTPMFYDQKADMFSLGVVFFEMWHPPFTTLSEKASTLGGLASGVQTEQDLQKIRAQLPAETPPEVPEILGRLLAKNPTDRTSADSLLNHSGLLPAGAYDPQVQRILRALEDPLSTESIALIEALFRRCEKEVAKDVSFFEQLFKRSMGAEDAEFEAGEAREALMQLLRDLCRKHGARHELCPLLAPAHTIAGPACRLVGADNTLLELRTDLTEPFARAGAARAAGDMDAHEMPVRARREYHLGSVYRESPASETFAMAKFGHPMDFQSAVVQILWWAGKDKGEVPATGQAQEVELLHLVAELMASAGLSTYADLQLTDTRLLPLLLLCVRIQQDAPNWNAGEMWQRRTTAKGAMARGSQGASQPLAPEAQDEIVDADDLFGESAQSGSNPALLAVDPRAAEKQTKRLLGAAETHAEKLEEIVQEMEAGAHHETPDLVALRRITKAFRTELPRLEQSAGELARCMLLQEADGKPTSAILLDLEQAYGQSPPGVVAAEADRFLQQQLRAILRALRLLVCAVEGLMEVKLELTQKVDWNKYGPGLFFMIILRDNQLLVCKGGRLDRMLLRFLHLHSLEAGSKFGSEEDPWGALRGISFEVAIQKLGEALSQPRVQKTNNEAQQARRQRERGRAAEGSGNTLDSMWWKTHAGAWPRLVLSADRDVGAILLEDAMRLVSGLWRLGVPCELSTGSNGPFDAEAVKKSLWPVEPDFILRLKLADAGGEQQQPAKGEKRSDQDDAAARRGGEEDRRRRDEVKSKRRVADSGAGTSERSRQLAEQNVRYVLEVHSDQARQATEARQASKERLDVDDRQRVFEFITTLMRRIPPKPLGLPMQRVSEAGQ